ncbi:MAG: 50S ribosomal protein L18 [Thermoplasmata archaeon]
MSIGPRYRVPFRRRREGRTDYRYRLKLLKSGLPRAVVRLSRHRVLVSITEFDPAGDRVLAAAESRELLKVGFPNTAQLTTPASYLTGYLAGLRAKAAGTDMAVLDAGLRRPSSGGRVLSVLKGLLDAGLEIPHGETGFPTPDRLNGSHLPHALPQAIEIYKTGIQKDLVKPSEAAA